MYEDEIKKLAEEFGSEEVARKLASQDRKLIRFYIPEDCLWKNVRRVIHTQHNNYYFNSRKNLIQM